MVHRINHTRNNSTNNNTGEYMKEEDKLYWIFAIGMMTFIGVSILLTNELTNTRHELDQTNAELEFKNSELHDAIGFIKEHSQEYGYDTFYCIDNAKGEHWCATGDGFNGTWFDEAKKYPIINQYTKIEWVDWHYMNISGEMILTEGWFD